MKRYFSPYSFSVLVGAVVVALLTGWYAFAFTPPQDTPPTCNTGDPGCDAPVNVGGTLQHKQGTLQVDYLKSHSDVDVADNITADGGSVLIFDSSVNKIDRGVLPFNQGDLIAPGDRPLISGLAGYLTNYFSIANLGISGTSASNVVNGVSFGPGNSIAGTASVGQPLLPHDVVAAGGVQVTYPNSFCNYYVARWRRCVSDWGYTQPQFYGVGWYDPRGVLNLSVATGITYAGCYSDRSCSTLKEHTGWATFQCNAPYRTSTSNAITGVYNGYCASGARGVRSCLQSITCHVQ
ncbi:MAG TPA: hypothetical protein VFE94_01390 [Candidatus Paceibacterota bacterium]|nr:hypothetical protein [Candidatus Paceibacterota bacterium]